MLNESLVSAGLLQNLYLMDVGFLAAVLSVCVEMTYRVTGDARRLQELSENLARQVDERTRELIQTRDNLARAERLAAAHAPRTLIVAGGVACNKALREAASAAAERLGIPAYFPSPHLSTDNAAMIAAAGTVKLQAGERAGFDLNADVTLRLQNVDNEEDALRKARVRYRL